MAFGFKSFLRGIRLVPASSTTVSQKGDLEVLDSSGKQVYHNGTTASPVVTEAHTATLTNKSIDADDNTITDISNASIKTGAAIARNKLAAGTANHVIINDGSGVLSSEAALNITRGGTGQATAIAAFNALSPSTTKGDLISNDGTNDVRLAVGTNSQVLTANSGTASGLEWTNSAVADNSITPAKLTTSVAGTGIVGGNGAALSLRPDPKDIRNCSVTTSVSGNALTLAIKGNDGTDPSASNPVSATFRNDTAATGPVSVVSLTSALSLVISSGSNLGQASGQNEYIYLYLVNNSGAIKLAATTTNSYDQGSLQTTVAEGGAGAADSRTALYSDAVYTSKPIRLLARLKSNQTVAGVYASNVTEISLYPFNDPSKNLTEIRCITGNGHGSTSTTIRRFEASPDRNNGTGITYAQSATLGSTFTIAEEGLYSIAYSDQRAGNTCNIGISLNSAQLTTTIQNITATTRFGVTFCSTAAAAMATTVARLYPGDVIRAHTDGTPDSTTLAQFYIAKVAP